MTNYFIKYWTFILLLLMISSRLSVAQDISAMEYYIDTDPGIGASTPISITGGANVNETFTIPTSGLSEGFHKIVFRVQDLNGIWSVSNSRTFYVSASNLTTTANISALEYFIDSDPGFGNATSIGISASTNIDINSIISTSALAVGFHKLQVRAQDSDGLWSNISTRSFYIANANLTTQANITAVEYYVDTDPGFGNGSPLSITAASNIDISSTISTSALTAGFHKLHVRAQDSGGLWSNISTRSFYIANSDVTTQADIIAMEYYIDADPGFGAGTSLTITTGTAIDFTSTLSTSSLTNGYHELNVRALDIYGNWSEIESRSFLIDAFPSGNITAYEYFFDSDPGYGSANNVAIPSTNDLDETINVPTTSLTAGNHQLGIRLINENGIIGQTDYYDFAVCDAASANFTADITCVGGPTTFTESSTSVLAGDIFNWDFDGDGSDDLSTTSGNQTFSYSNSGTFSARLSVDRAGCISTITVLVQVEDVPAANAGVNQSVCNSSATLMGNAPSINESGIWTISSGTATITDPSDPNTTVTNISTHMVEFTWTLTNTLGSCSDQNTVQVTANLPIVAMSQVATVDIGQTVNVDVQTSATINPGDVLTTTITADPTGGTAAVIPDGTIEYTPNPNATGSDSFIYRVTNQCGNFSESSIDITINNLPPTIDVTSLDATSGNEELTFDLSTLVSDPNNNIDLNSLRVITQPISGAVASIDASGTLTIDYTGIVFNGADQVEIEVCDLAGICTTQVIAVTNVDVGEENPPISVYNAVSPNGDGFHDFLEIENIESYPNNRVVILNKQGNEVAQFKGYNNSSVVFSDGTLPSGVYYYFILPGTNGVDKVSGHFVLKVD